jgi:hypothetical protein
MSDPDPGKNRPDQQNRLIHFGEEDDFSQIKLILFIFTKSASRLLSPRGQKKAFEDFHYTWLLGCTGEGSTPIRISGKLSRNVKNIFLA